VKGKDMPDQDLLDRISINPKVMAGKPVIKGTRLTVQFILALLGSGANIEDILGEYEGLTREDVLACLQFAREAMERTDYFPLTAEVK